MTPKHITDATLRVRDVLYEGLLLRKIPEDIARERANNLSTAVIEALRQMADEAKTPGALPLDIRDTPPPIRTVTIETDRMCTRTQWCGAREGHEGECIPPF